MRGLVAVDGHVGQEALQVVPVVGPFLFHVICQNKKIQKTTKSYFKKKKQKTNKTCC